MRIIVDAFGGDNAPLEVMKGSAMAVKELGVDIILTGNKGIIEQTAKQHGISLDRIKIYHAEDVIAMDDDPSEIMKSKKSCSMAEGLRLLTDSSGDAFVSAGSTGALVVGSTFIVKRIKSVKRAAIATLLPAKNGFVLLMDSGANVECRPDMLLQFGVMASAFMENVMGINNPRVGLLNIGTEETKGGQLQLESFELLKNAPINFVGNIEARSLPMGECDIVLTDGFTGNVVLKLTEGVASFLLGSFKGLFAGARGKLAGALVLPGIKALKRQLDYTEVGGAPLLGISKPVIKAHGSSNANAIKNAIRQAKTFAENKTISRMVENLSKYSQAEKQD